MSARIYRLLRNNKEEGPFTPEELIQKRLRPYDLIWIDGRSAAWSYPGELAEFKAYAPLPGENAANQAIRQQSPGVSPSVQAAIAVNTRLAQPVANQKPRYKVSAAWSKIQTVTTPAPGKIIPEQPHPSPSKKIIESPGPRSKSLSWEEAWLDWEKEKTTTPGEEPGNSPKATGKKHAPELETKYEESLDSLKGKYIEHVLQQKQKFNKSTSIGRFSEFILPSIALVVIFSIGYWLLHNTEIPIPSKTNTALKSSQPATPGTNEPITGTKENAVAPAAVAQGDEGKQEIHAALENEQLIHAEDRKVNDRPSLKRTTNDAAKHEENQLPVAKAASQRPSITMPTITDKPGMKADSSLVINSIGNGRTAGHTKNELESIADKRQPEDTDPPVKSHTEKSGADYINVPQYIALTDGYASLTIQNVSDINIDLAVIDLEYYGASNHFRKGETIYLHNLRAGRSVIVKTPKDINSVYATSKLSLVTADAENVYVVGDH